MTVKKGRNVINLDFYKSIRTYWIVLFVTGDNVIYFDGFGVKHIPKQNWEFIENKNITTNIYRIQGNDSIMRWYFCNGFVDFMLMG